MFPGRARSLSIQRLGLLVSLNCILLAACNYGFTGGGLPPGIKTVAILPFDNLTPEPLLTQEVLDSVRSAMERQLGLRPAGEAEADAVVTGSITRYEPDLPVAFSGTPTTSGEQDKVTVTGRLVEITLTVEIKDQKTGKVLWKKSNFPVQGNYDPTNTDDNEGVGRGRALNRLQEDIVQGAQSQW